MIDLKNLSEKEINDLEQQIKTYKEGVISEYEVVITVTFKACEHKDDCLTMDGELDPAPFEDFVYDLLNQELFNLIPRRPHESIRVVTKKVTADVAKRTPVPQKDEQQT